jgi:hypothetical protein
MEVIKLPLAVPSLKVPIWSSPQVLDLAVKIRRWMRVENDRLS